jgi:general secretion pathway protein K
MINIKDITLKIIPIFFEPLKKINSLFYHLKSRQGFALVLTLVILTILTAMVIEFSYGVYTTTSNLNNWKESQKLSLISKSGISLAIKTISDIPSSELYKFQGRITIPVANIVNDFQGSVTVIVEDENGRFNLNSIINQNQTLNIHAYNSFKRLLKNLDLREGIADYLADWIDRDNEPKTRDSEENSKNGFMDNVDELLLIKTIDTETFSRLQPYVTVYAYDKSNPQLININTATIPVIMSLTDGITKTVAEKIVQARPFESISDVEKVATGLGLGPAKITVRAVNYRIISIAEENKLKRIIECISEIRGSSYIIKYWKEN